MTREEAINTLNLLKNYYNDENVSDDIGYVGFDDEDNEALDMAIKALEQHPCEDTISRQEAIRVAEQGQIQGYVWQFKKLCTLSSVEPERKTGKWHVEGFNVWCTNCGFHPKALEAFNYCPSCGAKMEEANR